MFREMRYHGVLLALVIFAATGRTAVAESCQDCPQILGVTLPAPCVDVQPPGSGWTYCTVILTGRLDWSCQIGGSRCDVYGPPAPGGQNPWCYEANDPFWGITAENRQVPMDPVDCWV